MTRPTNYPIARLCTLPDSQISNPLHPLVLRSSATLGGDPVDDLIRVHDVARLAVDAVGRVDLRILLPRAIIDHLVDVGGAEADAGVAVLLPAASGADRRV